MNQKQPLTEEKMSRVKFSLKKMVILAQVLLFENQTELVDTDFAIPNMNNFAKRILSDSKTLSSLIHTKGRIKVKYVDTDFAEDYSGEIWRVITLLCAMDKEIIKEFADNLESELAEIIL